MISLIKKDIYLSRSLKIISRNKGQYLNILTDVNVILQTKI